MTVYSIAEAEGQLADLIDRALQGEAVIIANRGQQVVEIKPVRQSARVLNSDALPSIARRQARLQAGVDPVSVLMQMRDEDWR